MSNEAKELGHDGAVLWRQFVEAYRKLVAVPNLENLSDDKRAAFYDLFRAGYDTRTPDPQTAALRAALEKISGCATCKGSGHYWIDCSLCGDSTYDHYCNDKKITCKACEGSGINPIARKALAASEPAADPLREAATALVEKLETNCSACSRGCVSFLLSDDLTALKAALEDTK